MRFRSRHAHQTVSDFIEAGLDSLGWVSDPINFGTVPVTFSEIQPDENGVEVDPNTVAITFGNVPEERLEQLGDGVWSIQYPVFFDVYGVNGSIAVSIAEDIKDLLSHGTCIYLKDYTDPDNPITLSDYLEFEEVAGPERPPVSINSIDFRRHWRIIKGFATLYYGMNEQLVQPSAIVGAGSFS